MNDGGTAMTPSQLRNAAEILLARDKEVRELFMQSHCKEAAPTMEYHLARHILATVREDDGEEFTRSWAGQYDSEIVKLITEADGWMLIARMDIKTRGDFRQLCRLLGVDLKEANND